MSQGIFYDYSTQTDASKTINASRELIAKLQANSTTDFNDNKTSFKSTFPGYTHADLASMEQVFEKMDTDYRTMLTNIERTNNVVNMRNYVNDMYDSENSRVSHLKNQSINNVYKMREQFMNSKYALYYTAFFTNCIMFMLAVLIVCAIAMCLTIYGEPPKISMTIGICIVLTVTIIALIIWAMFYKRMQKRRKDDWTKFYFNSPNDGTNSSCSK